MAEQAGEDFAGAGFDEEICACGDEGLDTSRPADGAGDLFDERLADLSGGGDEVSRDIGGNGELGVAQFDGGEDAGNFFLRRLHEGAVEGRADLEHDDFAGAASFDELGGFFDGGFGSGDDGLVGGVEVGGGDGLAGGFLRGRAGFSDGFGVQGEDGGHGAFSSGDGGLHGTSAGFDGANGVGEVERAGGDVGGPFTEGVAGGESGMNAMLGEDAEGGDADGEDGGLGVLGEAEFVFGAVEEDAAEGEGEGFVGFGEGLGGDGEIFSEAAAHAHGLRTLAGEKKCDLPGCHT